jgi:hypothetical protein
MAANTSVVSMSVAIPQTRIRRGGAATVSSTNAFTLPSPQYHFPTPPNSISPPLPPVQKKADSDVDVSDISAGSGGMHSVAEAAGTITSGLLAKYRTARDTTSHWPPYFVDSGL